MAPSCTEPLAEAMRQFVPSHLFSRLPANPNADWKPQRLAWVSLLMAWDQGQTLTARWEHARQTARRLHEHWAPGHSYSGFTKALLRSPALTGFLKRRLRRPMRERAGTRWRCGRWPARAPAVARSSSGSWPRPSRTVISARGRRRLAMTRGRSEKSRRGRPR